jgi:hypothetical protein
MKKTLEIITKYDIPVVFCGTKGKEVALSILKRANEEFYASKNNTS